MSITVEEVKKIAELARLELAPEEEKRHAETISAVLEYMNILNEVDTSNVEPTFQVTGLKGVCRKDVVLECAITKQLIAQMPKLDGQELIVPGVFES